MIGVRKGGERQTNEQATPKKILFFLVYVPIESNVTSIITNYVSCEKCCVHSITLYLNT